MNLIVGYASLGFNEIHMGDEGEAIMILLI